VKPNHQGTVVKKKGNQWGGKKKKMQGEKKKGGQGDCRFPKKCNNTTLSVTW